MPEIIDVPPPVGARLHSFDQFHAMPVGAVIAPHASPTDHYTKVEGGQWQHGRSTNLMNAEDNFSLDGWNMVISYPEGYVPAPPPSPTLRQFQHKFRDHTLHAAEHHGVGVNVVTRAMTEMGVTEEFPPGVGMMVKSHTLRDALPENSVLLFGNPEVPRNFGMWAKHNGQWIHVLGDLRSFPNNQSATVHNVGGEDVQQDWLTEVGTDESTREIRSFKARAWRVSAKVRDQHSWCSTFESIMTGVGVDAGCLAYEITVNGMTVGDRLNPGQVATLPLGSILRWRHLGSPNTRVIWFERVDGADNQAGTRRIFGYRDDSVRQGNYADVMEVVHIGGVDRPMSLDVDLAHSRNHLPVGSVIQIGRDTNRYMLCQDRRMEAVRAGATIIPERGSYTWDQMGDATALRVVRFGAPA
jgi:hypothetical protein